MEISILGLQKSLHIVECLLNGQPPCRIIRNTADLFLLPYVHGRPMQVCVCTAVPGFRGSRRM
jgi:hypothetical protein